MVNRLKIKKNRLNRLFLFNGSLNLALEDPIIRYALYINIAISRVKYQGFHLTRGSHNNNYKNIEFITIILNSMLCDVGGRQPRRALLR